MCYRILRGLRWRRGGWFWDWFGFLETVVKVAKVIVVMTRLGTLFKVVKVVAEAIVAEAIVVVVVVFIVVIFIVVLVVIFIVIVVVLVVLVAVIVVAVFFLLCWFGLIVLLWWLVVLMRRV